MRTSLAALGSAPPALLWGLFVRLLGIVYGIAFGSLYPQVLALAGSRGITPVAPLLRKIREDYPSARRYAYFPSLLWVCASDRAEG